MMLPWEVYRRTGDRRLLQQSWPTIERWLTVPANQQEIEATDGAISAERIRRETPAHIERLAKLSDASFSAFVGLLGDRRRRGQQPHR